MCEPKLPGNVGTSTGTGTRTGTPLVETRYLGTSGYYIHIENLKHKIINLINHMTETIYIYIWHSHIIHAFLIFLDSIIYMNIHIEDLKHKIINLINDMT